MCTVQKEKPIEQRNESVRHSSTTSGNAMPCMYLYLYLYLPSYLAHRGAAKLNPKQFPSYLTAMFEHSKFPFRLASPPHDLEIWDGAILAIDFCRAAVRFRFGTGWSPHSSPCSPSDDARHLSPHIFPVGKDTPRTPMHTQTPCFI